MDARTVNKRYATHAYDAHPRAMMVYVRHQIVELIGYAEEVRPVDLIDGTALWNDQVLLVHSHVGCVAQVYFVLDDRDFCRFHDALHKESTGQDESNLNGDGEVEDDRQEESHAKHNDVALRVLQQATDGAPAAHVVSHDDQHGG